MVTMDTLRIYKFRDEYDHALEMVVPYRQMCAVIDALAAMNPVLANDHYVDDTCRFCGAASLSGPVSHDDDCPWIVATQLAKAGPR